jgi:hypothetical protein
MCRDSVAPFRAKGKERMNVAVQETEAGIGLGWRNLI